MLTPITVRGPLRAAPDPARLPADVTFTIKLEDESAPPAGKNRVVSLTIQPSNDVTFGDGSKRASAGVTIFPVAGDVSVTQRVLGTGRDASGQRLLQVSITMTDETLKTLGSVLLDLLP